MTALLPAGPGRRPGRRWRSPLAGALPNPRPRRRAGAPPAVDESAGARRDRGAGRRAASGAQGVFQHVKGVTSAVSGWAACADGAADAVSAAAAPAMRNR